MMLLQVACTAKAARPTLPTLEAVGWDILPIQGPPPNYVASPTALAIRQLLPEDVEQASIQMIPFGPKQFAVKWRYTELGAARMLAFRESHEDQEMVTKIGRFQRSGHMGRFVPMPPYFHDYAEWRQGWLKRRTDKWVGVTEQEAQMIIAGLKAR